ncbi:MAG: flagellar biosynthesis anti-sigma factor FlgM [Clostridiaceae bacterium]|nr:flagellar biosynthesis anti-sigma factor FlgM [Clostridiaceae bacterium]
MKIWGSIPKVSGIYGDSAKVDKAAKVNVTSSKKDELTISTIANDFNVALKALRQVPDVREDKVNEILKKMERGQYKVTSEDVAKKILGLK